MAAGEIGWKSAQGMFFARKENLMIENDLFTEKEFGL